MYDDITKEMEILMKSALTLEQEMLEIFQLLQFEAMKLLRLSLDLRHHKEDPKKED